MIHQAIRERHPRSSAFIRGSSDRLPTIGESLAGPPSQRRSAVMRLSAQAHVHGIERLDVTVRRTNPRQYQLPISGVIDGRSIRRSAVARRGRETTALDIFEQRV